MKRFIPILVLFTLSFNAFAEFSLDCPQIYDRVMRDKWEKKERVNIQSGVIGLGGVATAFLTPPVGLAIFAVSFGMSTYSFLPSKEERTLHLAKAGTRELSRFTRSLQKSISPDITQHEVTELVNSGLDSGLFCADFPKLASVRDIKKHVRETLKAKYHP
jgi:hypothetical protein